MPAKKTAGRQRRTFTLRGYVQGAPAAAAYLGVERRFFVRHILPHVRARIIEGRSFYSLKALDAFMDPDRNPPGAETEFRAKQ